MIRDIVTDTFFLRMPAQPAAPSDAAVADDLLDTLRANAGRCVGLAANMIGARKAVIVVDDGGKPLEMFNPVVVAKDDPYDAEEGCLSLPGTRPCRRYRKIKVAWATREGKPRTRTFTGFTAQIIQHEMDHLQGILI